MSWNFNATSLQRALSLKLAHSILDCDMPLCVSVCLYKYKLNTVWSIHKEYIYIYVCVCASGQSQAWRSWSLWEPLNRSTMGKEAVLMCRVWPLARDGPGDTFALLHSSPHLPVTFPSERHASTCFCKSSLFQTESSKQHLVQPNTIHAHFLQNSSHCFKVFHWLSCVRVVDRTVRWGGIWVRFPQELVPQAPKSFRISHLPFKVVLSSTGSSGELRWHRSAHQWWV